MFICYIPSSTAFTVAFPILFVHIFNRESQWDTSLGFLGERLSKNIKNTDHRRIIYRNDNIARPVKTVTEIMQKNAHSRSYVLNLIHVLRT